MDKEKVPTVFQKLTNFMEQNNRAVEFVSYGITGVGLLFALYKIKPFAKFKKPSDVPNRFLKTTELEGRVKRIDPAHGTLLLVDHIPLLPFPRLGREKYLPIKLAGINTTNHGISWLQCLISGKNVQFLPLDKNKNYLNCIVTFSEKDQERTNIAEELVKLGFATISNQEDNLLKNECTLLYHKSLIRADKYAKFNRNGHWHFVKNPTLIWKIKIYFSDKLKSLLPMFIIKQLNI
ncbi:PREDICTED: protein C3orf33 [Polistes dominula]|uniref:Protein C3orf33 n=1 Tax=Polistes dominula TaxID=743375 RepID=A0ABM1IDH6_POLDO|nr:PREDICTED: protein C3orf33 [Polistes dominula]